VSARELVALIGQTAELRCESGALSVAVIIDDAKSAYGRTRVLVRPISGSGELWADLDRVKLTDMLS
jgi:hypothetical protein